jgi:hypothetical protein
MSKKTKRELSIPDLKSITVTQSNRVTNAKVDYTLIQQRTFAYIMYNLQYEINQVMKGTSVHQLDIFNQTDSAMLIMHIPMHDLGIPSQYPVIRDAILRMSSVSIKLKTITKRTESWAGIFSKVTVPNREENKRSAVVTIEIRRDVAQQLIDVHYNRDKGRPEQYTIFMLYVALKCKQKYTNRIYQLLCSYRERGIYSCTVDELREYLAIPAGVYPNFAHLYNRVLEPTARELELMADIYFDPTAETFKELTGRKVTRLNFRVQYPQSEEMFARQQKNFIRDLITTFGCKEYHVQKILPYLVPGTNWNKLEAVRNKCYHLCVNKAVDHPAAHITRSIIAELTEV